jgi:hypothetical protein
MFCGRCQGLMCPVELRDFGSGMCEDRSFALRCLMCGEIVDPIILHNRTQAAGGFRRPLRSRRRHLPAVSLELLAVTPRPEVSVS